MDMIWKSGTSYKQGPPRNLYSIREFWLDLPSYIQKRATLQWNGQLVQKSETPDLLTSTKLGLSLWDGAATNVILKTNDEWKISGLANLPYPCN